VGPYGTLSRSRGFRVIDRYKPWRRDRQRTLRAELRAKHPERDIAFRWKRTSRGLFTVEEWHAKLDRIGWGCSRCDQAVTADSVSRSKDSVFGARPTGN
jgi:hypothetical protein